jgi:hypothetical protein
MTPLTLIFRWPETPMSLQGQVPLSAILAAGILVACFSPTPGAAAQGTSTHPAAAAGSSAPLKPPVGPRVAVFPIALNDLSNQPASPELAGRMQSLAAALGARLATACGYQVVPADSLAQAPAETAPGYLYGHPDIAVGLAASAHAEWIVIPRLNRASPWVTDLQAHVVRTRDTTLVSNRIVEVKGIELTPELAAKLVDRGAAWMADQVSQAIDHTSGASGSAPRRCPA